MIGEISVVIPAYRSEGTIAGCLAALVRQSLPAAEIIVVDSSPNAATAAAAEGWLPQVRTFRSTRRLWSHAARNLGVTAATGELLLFLDPDIDLREDGLARLVAAHARHGGVLAGALECYGRRWLDRGVHLTKFSKWLDGGELRAVDVAPTAVMMCTRALFDEIGGFVGEELHADALFSWEAARRGHGVWLEPAAVGVHHHEHDVGSFVRERFDRGVCFARMRREYEGWGRVRTLAYGACSVVPIRLARALFLVGRQATAAGATGEFLATLPVIALGYAASLAGEARGLAGGVSPRVPPEGLVGGSRRDETARKARAHHHRSRTGRARGVGGVRSRA